MPARTSPGRPGFQIVRFPAAVLGLALLCACTAPVYDRAASPVPPAPPMPPPVLDTLRVHELRGSATVQSGAQPQPLEPEAEVHENQPVQVGARSTLRLALGQRALLDLGPNSRVVVHKLPRDGKGEERATWLRLERGYLRVLWSDARGDTPMEVSFGRWAARIGAGEHFFDSRDRGASACSTNGTMSLSGVPEWTPKSLSEPCVALEPYRAPVEIALSEKDWTTLRTRHRLQPTLARAAQQQASLAAARLDRQDMHTVAWKPATVPDALPDGPPAPVSEPVSSSPPAVQELAFAPPTPAAVDAALEPAPVPTLAVDAPDPLASMNAVAPTPAPVLKWTENIEFDASDRDPVAPAVTAPETIDPAAVPIATPETDAQQRVAYAPAPQEEAAAAVTAVPTTLPEGDRAEWIVNVATYATPELAQQHAQLLVAENLDAAVRHEKVRGRSSYRVVIEGLPTEAAAQSAIADLGARYGVRSAWAMRKK